MIAKWEERYRRGDFNRNEDPDPLIVLAAEWLPPGHAIDLACGAGRHALFLAARGWRVTAIDGAAAALAQFDAPGITKMQADLEHECVPLAADLVVDTLYLDRALFPRMAAEAHAVAIVLPLPDDDPDIVPMNPAYLATETELPAAFPGWEIRHLAVRKQPGKRRRVEFLARRLVTPENETRAVC